MRKGFVALLLAGAVAAAALTSSDARADGPVRSPRAKALDLFEQSARAYREGRFQDAIDLLLEARRVKPEAVLLYNLGRAYEALGKQTEAADAYAGYLAEDPRAVDRRAIEGRIATLRAQAEQLDKAKTPPPSPPEERRPTAEPSPPEPESPSVAPWVITGVGVAGIGAGVVLGIVAKGRHDDAVADRSQASADDKQHQATTFATGATIAFIAGGALTAGGLTWLGIRALSASPSPSSSARVAFVPGLGSVALAGTF